MSPHSPRTKRLAQRILEGLAPFTPRSVGSDQSTLAAQFLARELDLHGFTPLEQGFQAGKSASGHWVGLLSMLFLGTLFAWDGLPVGSLGFILVSLGTWWFYTHFSGKKNPLDFLIPMVSTRNVLTRFGEGQKHLILMAHYDTVLEGPWHRLEQTSFTRTFFVMNTFLIGLSPLLVLARLYLPDFQPLVFLLTLYFAAVLAFIFFRWNRGDEGGVVHDNALGVAAAFETANRLWGKMPARVSLVLTSGQASGAEGAKAYLQTLGPSHPKDTLVINFDRIAPGPLTLIRGEGLLSYLAYPGGGVELARELGVDQISDYRFFPLDAFPFAQRGIPCLTLAGLGEPEDALDDGLKAVDFAERLAQLWVKGDQLN